MTGLTHAKASDLAATLKIVADPVRLQIIALLAYRPGHQSDLLVCLQLEGTAIQLSTLSRHLGRLVGAGLVSCTREGRELTYRLIPEAFGAMAALLRSASDR